MNFLSMLKKKTAVRELILWVWGVTIATLFIVGAGFYLYTTFSMLGSLRQQAHRTADEIASVLTLPLYDLDDQAAVKNARIYLASGRLSGIRLVSTASGILVNSMTDKKSMVPPVEREIVYKGMPLGVVTLMINDSEIRSAQRTTLIIILQLILGIFVVYALLLQSVFKRILSVHLNRIIQGIHRFGDSRFDEKIENIPYEDLNQLVLGLNAMAKNIQEKQLEIIESQKRLSMALKGSKAAEQELRHLQNYLSNIINSMPSALIGVDTAGRVTQWNSGARKITGFSPEEAAGQLLCNVFPRMEKEMEQVRKAMETRQVRQDKKRLLHTEGNAGYEDITIYPLVANGVDGAVIRIDDVTDQVRLEEMMVQSEKMLSVGGLAAGMAHEINNPLAGMIQTANVMKTRLTDLKIPANRRAAEETGISLDGIHTYMEKRGILRMIETINESGRRVAHIVDNMLSFARKGEAGASSHDPVHLMDQIIEIAASDYDLKKHYDFKTIKIIKEYEDHLPMVPCEGSKIQQVLLNILHNGAQAMQDIPDKNENREPPCFILRLSSETGTGMLKIEIQDNGPGMEETVRKRVFEPFFTTKPPGIGTGLGLSVSYFIITENHGGTMDVISSPGKGATFIIRLPLKPGEKRI